MHDRSKHLYLRLHTVILTAHHGTTKGKHKRALIVLACGLCFSLLLACRILSNACPQSSAELLARNAADESGLMDFTYRVSSLIGVVEVTMIEYWTATPLKEKVQSSTVPLIRNHILGHHCVLPPSSWCKLFRVTLRRFLALHPYLFCPSLSDPAQAL